MAIIWTWSLWWVPSLGFLLATQRWSKGAGAVRKFRGSRKCPFSLLALLMSQLLAFPKSPIHLSHTSSSAPARPPQLMLGAMKGSGHTAFIDCSTSIKKTPNKLLIDFLFLQSLGPCFETASMPFYCWLNIALYSAVIAPLIRLDLGLFREVLISRVLENVCVSLELLVIVTYPLCCLNSLYIYFKAHVTYVFVFP